MQYGIALLEKPGCDGLNLDEIKFLYGLVASPFSNDSDMVFPIELEARYHESSAMGFITPKAAEAMDYDYETSGLHDFIASILDDMDLESEDGHYVYNNVDIYVN